MTLVDVGYYDCWLICLLEDLPFVRMIGIEPRKKYLDKGRVIRQFQGIETRCEFRQGSIENLEEVMGGDKADVVAWAWDIPRGKPEWKDDHPLNAIHEFVASHPEFTIDPYWTRLEITSSPDGWLCKQG